MSKLDRDSDDSFREWRMWYDDEQSRRRELRARLRWTAGFILAVAVFVFAAATVARAHTDAEQAEWHDAWIAEINTAGGLTPELVEAFLAFEELHKPPPVRAVKAQPAPASSPPAGWSPGVEQWRPAIAAYDWNVEIMLRIMSCESGGNPNAVSHTDDHGLLQIHWPIWGPAFGYTRAQLHDPATNIDVAYRVYKAQGYRAWVCYR